MARPSLLVFGVVFAVMHVVGKVGDMLAPTLVVTHPLTLLALNANDLHLALAATATAPLPYFLVAGVRRCLEDPLFFLLGRWYGLDALSWFAQHYSGGAQLLEKGRPWFERAAPVCIVLFPNAAVGVLSGVSRMTPATFLALTGVSVAGRLIVIRWCGSLAKELVGRVLQVVQEYRLWFTVVTIAMGLGSFGPYLAAQWPRRSPATSKAR